MTFTEVVFFNTSVRLYFLRTVIAASLGAALCFIAPFSGFINLLDPLQIKWLATLLFIAFHHLLTIRTWKYFLVVFDLLLVIAEVIVLVFFSVILDIHRNDSEDWILQTVLGWITLAALLGLLSFRIAVIRYSKGPFEKFDILSCTEGSKKKYISSENLIGRALWKEQFIGENVLVQLLRGVLGTVLLVGLAIYILLNVIYEPIRETALSPTRESRVISRGTDGVKGLPPDFKISQPAWNIIPIMKAPPGRNATDIMLDSIRVIPVLNGEGMFLVLKSANMKIDTDIADNGGIEDLPPCTNYVPERYLLHPGFQCNGTNGVLVTVNFTALGKNLNISPTTPITLLLSFANHSEIDGKIILERAAPFPLIPGVNIVGAVGQDIRQVFSKPSLAAFGLFQNSIAIWSSRLIGIYPDPSPTVSKNKDISTLRLFLVPDVPELRIISDYTDNSVINGFSAVGGLWTTLSAIFALLFGTSLVQALLGSKPLTIFGLTHSFQWSRIQEEFQRKYPRIVVEQRAPEMEGLLAFLNDYLIDLSVFKKSVSGGVVGDELMEGEDAESVPEHIPLGEVERHLPV